MSAEKRPTQLARGERGSVRTSPAANSRFDRRAQRGLWAVIALGLIFALIYGSSAGPAARAAPVLALVLVVWAATLPTRRSKRDL